MEAKGRRKNAIIERRLAQKACKYFNKYMEKMNDATEKKCISIEEGFLMEYRENIQKIMKGLILKTFCLIFFFLAASLVYNNWIH